MTAAITKRHAKEKAKAKKFQTMAAPAIDFYTGGDVEIKDLVLDLMGTSAGDMDVTELITDGEIVYGIDGTEVTFTVHDQKRRIVSNRNLWDEDGELVAIDVRFDGEDWRVQRIQKQADDVIVTLELRRVARLREKKGPRKAASRAKTTRAEYILSLVRSGPSARDTPVEIPELHKRQKIAKETSTERKKKTKSDPGKGGFDKDVKISGVDDEQLRNISVFMEEADRLNASTRAVMAGLVAGFGESQWRKSAAEKVYGTHKGVFQSDQIPPSHLKEQSHYFLVGGRSFKAGGAIGYAKNHEFATLGEIAAKVEISDGSDAYYNTFRGKAKKVYDAWHGGTGSATQTTIYKRAEFKVDKGEDYWKAIQRMAEEVRWRAFFSGGTFYYISEERLYAAAATYTIREGENGVSNIDFDEDARKVIGKATVDARIDRWAAPPGVVIIVEGLNGTGSKRWLVESVRRPVFSPEAEITLKRMQKPKLEPRTSSTTKETDSRSGKRGHVSGDTKGLTDDMLQFLQEVAGETDEKIVVTSGKDTGHAPNSTHHSGNGADIDVGGDSRSNPKAKRKGDLIAIAAMVVCGLSRQEARRRIGGPTTSFAEDLPWGEYQIEMGWQTLEGGNHYNHVHCGLDNWQDVQNSAHKNKPVESPRREIYSANDPSGPLPSKETTPAHGT